MRGQVTPICRQIGEALRDLQKGVKLGMPLSRPMPVVAPGVYELRIRREGTTVRIFYYVRKVRYVNFPANSNAVRKGFYYRME
jgi:phage-related protein